MADFCEICGDELDSDEEIEGICKKCKKDQQEDQEYEKDEDFIDPGIT